MSDVTYFEETDALAELADAVLQKWSGTHGGNAIIKTPVGTISKASWTIFIRAGDGSLNDDTVVALEYRGEYTGGKKNPSKWVIDRTFGRNYDGKSIERAREIVVSVSQYLASDDFQKKINGSISLMKKLTKAIKGED